MISWKKSGMVLACCWLGLASCAMAQYVWVDEKGVKQFSDQPPPPNVPKNRIIKGPAKIAPKPSGDEAQADGDNAAASAAPAAKAPPSVADRNADYKKRAQEQADKDKKLADETARKEAQRKNCERARDYQRSLDSGVRISTVNANGERTVMTDEQRARETAENRRSLAECQ